MSFEQNIIKLYRDSLGSFQVTAKNSISICFERHSEKTPRLVLKIEKIIETRILSAH